MSASIFVNKSDRIEVTVHYRDDGKGGVEVVGVDSKPKDGKAADSITAKFRKPDFGAIQRITQASTVFNEGVPSIDVLRAGKAILYHLIDSWDVRDDKGVAVPCDLNALNSLAPAIGNALSAGVQGKMGNLSQMFS